MTSEVWVSVDIEASGPSPSTGSLLSIGACLVDDPGVAFYVELQPIDGLPWSDAAQLIHGLDQRRLEQDGLPPTVAMERLADWLADVADGRQPVFVGFNAPFDWLFVADYFHRFLARNPFGISALDMKAYYMGRERVSQWAATTHAHVNERYGVATPHTHNALDDAREQAALMQLMQADE
jgi:ribonuclease T